VIETVKWIATEVPAAGFLTKNTALPREKT